MASGVRQFWFDAPTHSFTVRGSTSQRATVDGQFPPRLDTVFKRVMYVPPIRGSLTLALKAIIDTYMLYSVTCEKKGTLEWWKEVFFFFSFSAFVFCVEGIWE